MYHSVKALVLPTIKEAINTTDQFVVNLAVIDTLEFLIGELIDQLEIGDEPWMCLGKLLFELFLVLDRNASQSLEFVLEDAIEVSSFVASMAWREHDEAAFKGLAIFTNVNA